eukprot:7349154-Alexandrium_andersonii.AAC.1
MVPPPRPAPVPRKPNEKEVRRHQAVHLPYAAWCETCVKARGRARPHRTQPPEPAERLQYVLQIDYCLMTSEGSFTKDEGLGRAT